MKKRCVVSGAEFEISDEELKFYEKFQVPHPTHSPLERQRRRTAFRNFRNLYYRKSSLSGERLLSMYDAEVPFPVYSHDEWWADSWSAQEFGRSYDLSRPFFVQFRELSNLVPRVAIINIHSENSQFANMTLQAKDCYLVFGCVRSEGCLYGHIVWDSRFCLDCLYVFRSEWCSNSADLVDCYCVHYSEECNSCRESYFLYDCVGCSDCFACFNLRNKQYHFFNEPCTKQEYFRRINQILPLRAEAISSAKEWIEYQKKSASIYPAIYGFKNEDVEGNHIYESKNLAFCFDAKRCEESRYCFTAYGVEHSSDISFTGASTRFALDSLTLAESERVMFSHLITNCHNIAYSQFCYGSHDLFGCIGLRNSEFCILNRQYSKNEYLNLREKIVKQMRESFEFGEFFPIGDSPFAYNESIASEYMPLTKQQVLQRGMRWREFDVAASGDENSGVVPDDINKAGESCLNQTYSCKQTGRHYRIQKAEYDLCKRMRIALPALCPDRRHILRMQRRTERNLYTSRCVSCGGQLRSALTHERLYCEKCYLETLYRAA